MAEAAEHTDELTTARIPAKCHPSKKYTIPVHTFGSKGQKHSFRADWCEKYKWLHYRHVADAAIGHLCVTAEREMKFLASNPPLITRGNTITNWKDATKAFSTHLASFACPPSLNQH